MNSFYEEVKYILAGAFPGKMGCREETQRHRP